MPDETLYGIPARVTALRARYAKRDAAALEVQAVRRGDVEQIAPDLFSQQFPKSIVANMVDTTARDVAAVLAPLPSFSCSSTSMTSDRAKAFADKRTKIVRHYVDSSELQEQMLDGADDLNSYGMIVTRVEPDFKARSPYIKIESAVGAYPMWNSRNETVAFARSYKRHWFDVVADYPHVAGSEKKYPSAVGADTKVEVVHYEDDKRILVYVPDMGNLPLEDMPNPAKRCMVVCTKRPGAKDDIKGAYDDVIWVQFARHRLQSLLIEGVDQAVRAPLVVPEDANEVALGPNAIIRTRQGVQAVGRARLDMPAQAFGAVESLKGEQQLGAMSPEARSGSVDASIITGRGVQQLMAGFSTQIAAAQMTLRGHYRRVVQLCFEMDEALFGTVEKDVRGNDAGVPYSIRYRPDRDIDGDHTVDISYGFAAGLDPNRALVFLLQADGAGLVSKDYVRRALPVDLNAVEEERKIKVEQSREALVQAFSALTQSIPQLVAVGQDPMPIVMAQAKFVKLIQKGVPIEEAVLKALEPPEPEAQPAAQELAPQAQMGAEASAMGMAAAPSGPPDLEMLMAGLTSRGQPNLQANVSRQRLI